MRFSYATVALAGLAAASPTIKTRETGITIVDETLEVVIGAGGTISTQLGDISGLLVGIVTGDIVPQVQASLQATGEEFVNIQEFVTGQLEDTVVPLAEAELEVVLTLLEDTTGLVEDVKGTLEELTSGVYESTLTAVQAEAEFLIGTIEPAVSPVLELSSELLGTATGDLAESISEKISGLKDLVTSGLEPIQEAIAALICEDC